MRMTKETTVGIFYIATALAFLSEAVKLRFGTLAAMDAGFFPVVLSAALLLFGVASVIRGLRIRDGEAAFDLNAVRPILWVTASVLVFAAGVRPLGFLVATPLAVALCCFAVGRPRPAKMVLLTVSITTAAWLIFIVGLGLPWRLLPG